MAVKLTRTLASIVRAEISERSAQTTLLVICYFLESACLLYHRLTKHKEDLTTGFDDFCTLKVMFACKPRNNAREWSKKHA